MNGIALRTRGDREDPRGVQVALGRRGRSDRVGLVRGAHVKGLTVDVAVDGDRPDAEVAAGADDAERDLAAVRDEDLLYAAQVFRAGSPHAGGCA